MADLLLPGGRVLVVGEQPTLTRLLVLILSRAGLEVQEARPTQIDRLLARGRPRLVVLDLQFPPHATLRLCRRLRQDPATASLPVAVLAPSGDAQLRAHVLAAGATVCLDKPFRLQSLRATIQRLLAGRYPSPAPSDA
jgi:DNA-binding response OmpR family regulator